jgi:3-dehydroquinate synthase
VHWSADVLMNHMSKDKKVRDGLMTFVVARGIGKSFISRDIDAPDVHAVLSNAISA